MAESLETGFVLMAAGMVTVFVLLASLVYLVRGVSKLSRWLDGASAATPSAPAATSTSTEAADAEIVTVIGAAIAAFERGRRRI